MLLLKEDMPAKHFFGWLLAAVLQIFAFPLLHDSVTAWYTHRYSPRHTDVMWGLNIHALFIEYITIISVQLMCLVLLPIKKRLIILSAATVIFLLLLSPYFSGHPLRTFNLLATGTLVLWFPYLLSFISFPKKNQPVV
jgi:hypothetical protein